MSWLERVLDFLSLKAAPRALPAEIFTDLARFSGTSGVPPPERYYEMVKRYGTSAWVYAAVHRKAVDESEIPLAVKRRIFVKGKATLEAMPDDHPLELLLDRVNDFMTYQELVEVNAINLDLSGNDYWLIFPNLKGEPTEIWPLRPDWVTIVPDAVNFIRGYLVSINGAPARPFEPIGSSKTGAGILHFKRPNPWDYFYGQGALKPSWNAALTDEAAVAYRYHFYKNSGRPDGVLTSEKALTATQVMQIQEWWAESFRGYANAHRVAVLDNGFKYAAIGVNPKDADVVRDREMSRDDILVSYGVSMAVLGIESGDVGRREEQIRHYWDSTVKPNVLRRAGHITEFLAKRFGDDLVVVPDFSGVRALQEDELRAAEIDNLRLASGVLTINEVRTKLGLDPVDWGDVPYQATTAAGGGQQLNLTPTDIGGLGSPETAALRPRLVRVASNGHIRRKVAWPTDLEARGALWEEIIAKAGTPERGMRRDLATALRRAGREVADAITASSLRSEIPYALQGALTWFQAEAARIAQAWLPDGMEEGWKEAHRLMRAMARAKGVLIPAVRAPAAGSDPTAIAAVDFSLDIPGLRGYLDQRPKLYADLITATLADQMRALLEESHNAGDTIPQTADKLATEFDQLSLPRATMIARTELLAASNLARMVAYQESQVVDSQEWLSARDERVRTTHAVADGEIVPLGARFEVGSASLRFPGDPEGPAEEIINCRCVALPVIAE